MSDFAFAGLCGHPRKVVDLTEHLMGFTDNSLSGSRQSHFPLRSLKKADAQFLFQLPDLLTERGLADVQTDGSTAEVQFLGNGDKIP
jgi:hypothetical protein